MAFSYLMFAFILTCLFYLPVTQSDHACSNQDTKRCGENAQLIQRPTKPGSVLMYLPFSLISLMNPFITIAEALAKKGYFVTLVLPKESSDLKYLSGQIQQIVIEFDQNILLDLHNKLASKDAVGLFQAVKPVLEYIETCHTKTLTHPDMQLFLQEQAKTDTTTRKTKTFDVVLVPGIFNEIGYYLAEMFNAPLMMIMSSNFPSLLTLQLGYFDNPSFVTNFGQASSQEDMSSFSERLAYYIFYSLFSRLKQMFILPPQMNVLKGLNLTENVDLLALESEAAFGMYMTHRVFDAIRPTLPNTIDIGFIHCRDPRPLPEDLQEWIDQSDVPVVYVSFGSLLRVDVFDQDILETLKAAFLKTPYRFLIRANSDLFQSNSIKTCEWCPQQDILGHPKMALFITHGGFYSFQESLYHSIPMIFIPFTMESKRNSEIAFRQGLGQIWTFSNYNSDTEDATEALYMMIIDMIINNGRYKANVTELMKIVKESQLETPIQRALFWIEYVIKHGDAPYLKSPSRHLSYLFLLYWDIHLFLTFLIILTVFVAWKVLMRLKQLLYKGRVFVGNVFSKKQHVTHSEKLHQKAE